MKEFPSLGDPFPGFDNIKTHSFYCDVFQKKCIKCKTYLISIYDGSWVVSSILGDKRIFTNEDIPRCEEVQNTIKMRDALE